MIDSAPLWTVITVEEVNQSNRTATGIDKHGSRIVASYRTNPLGILRVPKQMELWLVERRWSTWFFHSKLDTLNQHEASVVQLSPGDMRIANENTYLEGNVFVNMLPIGAQHRETFFDVGGFTSVDLTNTFSPDLDPGYLHIVYQAIA